jgi:hypothetical protein
MKKLRNKIRNTLSRKMKRNDEEILKQFSSNIIDGFNNVQEAKKNVDKTNIGITTSCVPTTLCTGTTSFV